MTKSTSNPQQKLGMLHELGSFWGAEFLSGGIAIGAMYAFQQIPDKIIDPAAVVLGKFIEPIQPGIEKVLGAVSHIDAAKTNKDKPVEERAQGFAKKVILQAMPALAIGWGSKMGLRRWFNGSQNVKEGATLWEKAKDALASFKFWKWDKHEKTLFLLDEGVHTLAMIGMQSKAGAPLTNKLIDNMTNVGVKLGCSEQDAHDNAVLIASHEIPNLIAGLSVSAEIANRHMGWTKVIKDRLSKKPATVSHSNKLDLENMPYNPVDDLSPGHAVAKILEGRRLSNDRFGPSHS